MLTKICLFEFIIYTNSTYYLLLKVKSLRVSYLEVYDSPVSGLSGAEFTQEDKVTYGYTTPPSDVKLVSLNQSNYH